MAGTPLTVLCDRAKYTDRRLGEPRVTDLSMDRGPTCNIGWTLRACAVCFGLVVLVQEVGGRPWRSSGGYQLMVSEVFGHV